MPWPPDSGFPPEFQIGQGAVPGYATELDVDTPETADQWKRLRNRDEYLKGMLSDGAAAPEGLNVKSINVAENIAFPERALIYFGL